MQRAADIVKRSSADTYAGIGVKLAGYMEHEKTSVTAFNPNPPRTPNP